MTKKRYQPIDLSAIKTISLARRAHKVKLADLAGVSGAGVSFAQFLEGLPRQLAAEDFRAVVAALVGAHQAGKPIIWGLGAHVIKCGLSPLIIEMMRRGLASAVALNGAGAIHDVEMALVGETSEDVAQGLVEGDFGMAQETGAFFAQALGGMASSPAGLGELLGRRLHQMAAPHRDISLLAQGMELGIPVTVHVALGTDVIHMHPQISGSALGETSLWDFRLLCSVVAELGGGGVYLNLGSAVVLPEVFLKALTVARNLGHEVTDFATVNMDMIQHYRPRENVLRRPTAQGGRSYALTGHHELMVPLLVQAVIEGLESGRGEAGHA